ncbi:MAG: IS30 family transposase, partial [Deltaproteobacteria bacterium]
MKNASKLTSAEREEISILLRKKYSFRDIARALHRSPNTISYEVRTNSVRGVYDPQKAHLKAHVRLKYRRYQWRAINHSTRLRNYIIQGLKHHWNPDEISGSMREKKKSFYASKTAIYEWLYSVHGQRYCHLLYSKRYRKKKRTALRVRTMIPDRVSIAERPQEVMHRKEIGHWEGDAVVSGKRGKGALAVALERTSRLLRVTKVVSLAPVRYAHTLQGMVRGMKVTSWTFDNGIENRAHHLLEASAFFCDPYASWQKGGVENANKMLRRYFPKG